MESKIQTSLIQTNIKNMLLAVMAGNYYVLMINLVNLLVILKCSLQFFYSMNKESKYCSEVMKKHLNKELLMAKE